MRLSVPLRPARGRCANRGRKGILEIVAGCAVTLSALISCGGHPTLGEGKPTVELTSPGFRDGKIQKKFTCDGADVSPDLSWSAPPAGTKSFALLVIDPDAPVGEFVHWVLYDLPAEKRGLPEGVPKERELADGSRQGKNDFDNFGYKGPCPPGHSPHRYIFSLYALDGKLNLPGGATRKQWRMR